MLSLWLWEHIDSLSHACGPADSEQRLESGGYNFQILPLVSQAGVSHLKHGPEGDSSGSSHKYVIYVYLSHMHL